MLYFDHNATTFVASEVADTLHFAMREVFGNPSSTHRPGQRARQELERARRGIADFMGAEPAELVFTSGGTEANNLAILGLVRTVNSQTKHVVTTAIEHPSVLDVVRQLKSQGVGVSVGPVGAGGVVNAAEVAQALRPDTVLVSVMHANNEVGTLQPIAEIGAAVRARRAAGQPVYFHSDGVQALGKVDVDMRQLNVDLYSISGHKIFAPKGVGGLFVRQGTPLRGIQHGGRQERERRAGTENVPGAMAFARATELCRADTAGLGELRDFFEAGMLGSVRGVEVNGAPERRLPNTSNLLFRELSAESLVIALDMRGIAASTGAACSSGSVEPSHVLLAMGRSRDEAKSSVRFSFGRYHTHADVEALIEGVRGCVAKLQATRREAPVAVA